MGCGGGGPRQSSLFRVVVVWSTRRGGPVPRVNPGRSDGPVGVTFDLVYDDNEAVLSRGKGSWYAQ